MDACQRGFSRYQHGKIPDETLSKVSRNRGKNLDCESHKQVS